MNVNLKNKNGITLVALIITIIVLLILAMVSIRLVMNDGIIGKAERGTKAYKDSEENEQIQLAYQKYKMDRFVNPSSELTVANATTTGNETEGWIVTFNNGNVYTVSKDGKIRGPFESAEAIPFDAEEWDKTAATEDCFIWASDDPTSSDYGTVIGYNSNIQNYTILKFPTRTRKITSEYREDRFKDVSANESRAFTNNIKKLEIPGTAKSLFLSADSTASQQFTSVEEVVLSTGVERIEGEAFYNFSNLKNITIPDSVNFIGMHAFASCIKLSSISIPNGITEICFETFAWCINLNSITIPNSVTKIDQFAFIECKNLKNIVIPSSVTVIAGYAFQGWDSSQTINIRAISKPDSWSSDWNLGCNAIINWGYTGE